MVIAERKGSTALTYLSLVNKARKLELPILSKDRLKLLVEHLVFAAGTELLLKRGGDLILILDSQYRHASDSELTDLFHHISPNLDYCSKTIRDGSARELDCVWVYVNVEPPTRCLPPDEYGWNFRQSLWSFL